MKKNFKFLYDMKKVWKVTKKPSKKDYFLTVKVVLIGLLIIGVISLVMEFLSFFVIHKLFS